MTKPKADVDLVTNVNQAVAELKRYTHAFGDMMHKMENSTKRQKKSAKGVGDEMGKWGKGIRNAALGLIGMQSAASALLTIYRNVTEELRTQEQIQKDARVAQLGFSEAMEELRIMYPPDATASMADVEKMIIDSPVADKSGIARTLKAMISAGLTSDTRGLTELLIDLGNALPTVAKSDPEGFQALATALIEQKRAFGGSNEEQLGRTLGAIQAARAEEVGQFATYAAPAISQLGLLGFTQQEASSILASISTTIADKTMETTGNNAVIVFRKLFEESAKLGINDRGMELIRRMGSRDPKGQELQNIMIGAMQEGLTDSERQTLAKNMGSGVIPGKSRAKFAFAQFFEDAEIENEVKNLFSEAMKIIPGTAQDAVGRVQKMVAERASSRTGRRFEADRITQNYFSQRELVDAAEAAQGDLVEATNKLGASRAGGFRVEDSVRQIRNLLFAPGMTEKEAYEQQLRDIDREQQLLLQHSNIAGGQGYSMSVARRLSFIDDANAPVKMKSGLFGLSSRETTLLEVLKSLTDVQRQQLELLQEREDRIREMIERGQSGAIEVTDVTPKLSEPATPAAAGVANQ